MIYLSLPWNRNKLTIIASLNYDIIIRITIWMLHTITKRIEMCIDVNIKIC